MPTQKLLERKALIVGIVINVLQVLAGMAVFFMTGLKAMFLDFSFTAISVLSGMVAVYLSSRTVRTTERFPNGMFALEPIYAICKAIFTMSLLVYSLIDVCRVAYDYFVFGSGERIETGPVVIYEILTVIVCFSLYTYYRRSNRSIGDSSTMLTAECKSTLVDGSMSFGIGVVAIFLMLLPAGGPLDFLHYTGDFFKQAIDRWVEDNVSYIKSVPEETLGEMKDVILDGYEQGKTYTSIVSDIQDRYNVSKSKAKFLARDQISTLNAQITKKQQTDAGCNSYIWSTSKDSRVRDCHASLDGKEFSWDDPPEMWYMTKSGIKYSGRRCHPGEDYCCRCVALPKFIFEDIDIPV